MGQDLFGRIWQVTIGPAGQQGRAWDGLRTRFEVKKTGTSAPNSLELEIYNLSADSRAYVDHGGAANSNFAILLEAGYEDTGLKTLFTGKLDLSTSGKSGDKNHHHQGPDWQTEVKGRDGIAAYRSTILSASFGPKTSESPIIHHIATKMGVTLGKVKGMDKTYNHGRALTGSARAELDAMCRTHGTRWSIQDGVLQILPLATSLDQNAIVLSASSGMIGSPERTERGVKVVSLLRGEIIPGTLLDLEGKELKGFYVAENVTHRGDSHGKEWYTEIEALTLAS